MLKRIVLPVVVAIFFSFIFLAKGHAFLILTKEEALKKLLGDDVEIKTENQELIEPMLSKVKSRLGGELVHFQQGSKSRKVSSITSINFYFGEKKGQRTGVVIIDLEPGKWGPVEFAIALTPGGEVTRVEVLSYEEKRGRPIARHSFLSQFEGKSSKNPIRVNTDITGISGATISSDCATFAVRKAIALYEEFYLNK
jgi:hypothetical protein